jgi:hypothetical protein
MAEAPLAITSTRSGPLRPISFTANETIARQIVDRLCRQPPYGLSWRDFAVREIARAITAATPRQNGP